RFGRGTVRLKADPTYGICAGHSIGTRGIRSRRAMTSAIARRHFLASLPALVMAPKVMAQSGNAPIRVRALSHMTLTVSDPKRSVEFYQGLFGLPIQARQGPTSLLRIGRGPQFLALSGGGANVKPGINH